MTHLRPAAPEDLDGIVEVFWACWTRSYPAFAPADVLDRWDPERARHLWASALAGGGTRVAVAGDRVVGIVRHTVMGDRVDVHSLYVHPDQQGGGLGTQLLGAALAEGAGGGRLWVFTGNAAARDFYAARGWRPDGVTRTQPEFGLPETRLAYAPAPTSLDAVAAGLCGPDVCALPGETPPAGVVVGVDGACAAAGVRGPGLGATTVDTWFDLASVTKLVTTCALMRLVSAGALALDDPAARWVPGVRATVRQLLLHRGGLVPWQPLYLQVRDDRAAALRVAADLPAADAPGGRRAYSDLGFMVLGAIVAACAGAPLEDAVDALVARPLGLDLAYVPRGAVAAGALGDAVERRMVATGDPYAVTIDGTFDGWRETSTVGEPNDGNAHHAFGGVAGHAGCFGTVPALHALGGALAAYRDHDDLWRPDVVEEFLAQGPDAEQCLGFRAHRLADGSVLHHHPGFTGCSLGFVAADEAAGRHVVAIGANRLVGDGDPVPTARLRDVVLAATLEAR